MFESSLAHQFIEHEKTAELSTLPPHPYAYFTTWRHSSVNESPLPVECPAVLHGGHFRRNLRPLFRLIGSIKGSVRQRASRRFSIQNGVFLPRKDWKLGTF